MIKFKITQYNNLYVLVPYDEIYVSYSLATKDKRNLYKHMENITDELKQKTKQKVVFVFKKTTIEKIANILKCFVEENKEDMKIMFAGSSVMLIPLLLTFL